MPLGLGDAERELFLGELDLARLTDETPRGRWLRAVGLGARGLYAAAWELLDPVLLIDDRGEDGDVSLAASAAASFHRQLGRHVVAAGLDEFALALALRSPTHPSAREAELDARVGFAADAVGLGDLGLARRRLALASAVPEPGWRAEIRLDWIRTEVALLGGDLEGVLAPALAAVHAAELAGARRHLAKSLLFVAVAREVAGEDGRAEAGECLRIAESIGALSLVWPARSVLAGMEPENSDAHEGAAASAITAIAAGTPPAIAHVWLQAPDVARFFTARA